MRLILLLVALAASPASASAEAPSAALYLRGEGAEVRLGGGNTLLPAARFGCAGCHGEDGLGRREGGTVFPAIDWATLTDPARPVSYDTGSLARAVTEGIAADGRRLAVAMPRYSVPPDTLRALPKHLAALSTAARTGIRSDTILVTRSGDASLDAGGAAAFAAVNAAGGAYGRVLRLTDAGGAVSLGEQAAAIAAESLRQLLPPLLAEVRRRDHRQLRVAGPPPKGLAAALAGAGIVENPTAPAVLILGDVPADLAPEDELYGPADRLGPHLEALLASGHRVTVAISDPLALAWAVAAGRDSRAAEGYAAARRIARAALAAGRAVTAPALAAAATAPPLTTETMSFP
jgi:mono/diheme cytochrome c family protein